MHWYVITNSILLLQKSVCYCTKVSIGPLLPCSPFCVCFTVFYILNRQVDLQKNEFCVIYFEQYQSVTTRGHYKFWFWWLHCGGCIMDSELSLTHEKTNCKSVKCNTLLILGAEILTASTLSFPHSRWKAKDRNN